MKLHYIALAAASLLGTTAAQSLSDLPSCATQCATDSLPKGCNQLDIGCICSNKSFISDMSCCAAKSCAKDDQETTLKFARQICGSAGVNDLPQSASCSSGASETTATTGSSTETTASASGASDSTTVATTSAAASSTESASSSAASETPTNAAAAVGQNKEAVLAVAAAFALLA